MIEIQSKRLILRQWRPEDLKPFALLNQDIHVMEYYSGLLSEQESAAFIDRASKEIQSLGFGLFACALKGNNQCIGYVGLSKPQIQTHFTPCIEIGWRLSFEHWGQGYATEAAKIILHKGFNDWRLTEIVSFTTSTNRRSRRVMEKIGMTYDSKDDFRHPNLPVDHPLSTHVLYRLTKQRYEAMSMK